MIKRFKHRGLRRFFCSGDARAIPAAHLLRIERMLDMLDSASSPRDMNLPGWKCHPLKGERRGTWAVSVSGNLRLSFRFSGPDAIDVDLEDYH